MEQAEPHTTSDLLDCARTHLRSAIDEAREAVWDLRQNSDVTDISPLLERIAGRVSQEFVVPVACSVSANPMHLINPLYTKS